MGARIHWAKDGTALLQWDGATGLTLFTETHREILDGDNTLMTFVNHLNGATPYHLLWSFGGNITVDKVIVRGSGIPITFYGSVDSTDGIDGTWTQVGTANLSENTTTTILLTGATDIKWLRTNGFPGSALFYAIQIFGEYTAPRFELWNSSGSAELNESDYPLQFSVAGNAQNSNQVFQFKLKNTDSVSHDYILTVRAVRYAGDPVVANNFKLSKDDGINKNSSISITGVVAGGFCMETLGLYLDLVKEDNQADGYHYVAVDVEESA